MELDCYDRRISEALRHLLSYKNRYASFTYEDFFNLFPRIEWLQLLHLEIAVAIAILVILFFFLFGGDLCAQIICSSFPCVAVFACDVMRCFTEQNNRLTDYKNGFMSDKKKRYNDVHADVENVESQTCMFEILTFFL